MEPVLTYYGMGAGVVAFSSTRQGGCSTGKYASFNINRYCGDDEQHIRQNREALCKELSISNDRIIMPHQTHDCRVACIDDSFLSITASEQQVALEGIDALMTCVAGVCIGVSTADCIPILLHDTRLHIVCAIHAGWRGTVGCIAQKAIAAMAAHYGCQPADIVAQIGPGISMDSFEVGQNVYDAFAAAGFDMNSISRIYPSATDPTEQKWHINLPVCNRNQLVAAGLSSEAIADCAVCTYRNPDSYFSARRLGIHSGRIFTGIMVNDKG